eukprot:14523959-Alexandrium_andersonii.AAC.1
MQKLLVLRTQLEQVEGGSLTRSGLAGSHLNEFGFGNFQITLKVRLSPLDLSEQVQVARTTGFKLTSQRAPIRDGAGEVMTCGIELQRQVGDFRVQKCQIVA